MGRSLFTLRPRRVQSMRVRVEPDATMKRATDVEFLLLRVAEVLNPLEVLVGDHGACGCRKCHPGRLSRSFLGRLR